MVTHSTSGVSITIGGYSNDNTTMLDGSNIADGTFIVAPDGNECQMVNGARVIVEMPLMEKKSTSGVLGNSVFTPLSLNSSSLPKGVSVGTVVVGAPLSIQDYNKHRKTMVNCAGTTVYRVSGGAEWRKSIDEENICNVCACSGFHYSTFHWMYA